MAVEFILILIQSALSATPYLSLDSNFYLGWEFSDASISMTFNCLNTFSWCGMDFTYGMENTEMIIALNDGGKVTVTDYYSTEFTKPSKKLNTFTVTSSVTNSSGIFVTFNRPLNTGNSLDKILSKGLKTPISFAYLTTAGEGFSRHNHIGQGLLIMGVDSDHSIFISGANVATPMIQLDNNFTLGWDFTPNAIYFYFNCYNIQGWCGVTFAQGMSNTEMIIAYKNGSTVELTDYYSLGYEQPSNLTGLNLQVISTSSNSSGIFATFTRPLQGTSLTSNFSINSVTYLSFAYLTLAGQGFIRHNRIGKGTLVLGQLQSTSQFQSNPDSPPVISLDQNFTISWQFLKNYIVFTFSCQNTLGWCGISFVQGMENTELIVMENMNNSYLNFTDYYSDGYHKPTQTINTQFSILDQEITESGIMATFSRLLKPGGLDQSIAPGQCQDFSYAYLVSGGIGFRKHNYTGYGALTFGADSNSAKWAKGEDCLAKVSFDSNFSMSWVYVGDYINITFACSNIYSWCGITFVHGMENTEMIILLNNGGTLSITDYYSTQFAKPVNGTGATLTLLTSTVNENGIFATFSRLVNQKNNKTQVLTPGIRTDLSWAYLNTADQGLQAHNHRGTGLMVFGADSGSAKFIPGGSDTAYVALDDNFNLGWVFTDTTIDFQFDCLNIGSWCGISFTHGMLNTEMIVALYTGSEITVTDYYSTATVRPSNLTHMPLFITNSSYSSSGISVSFSRPLGSISSQTVKFTPGVQFDFSFAYLTAANAGFQQHDNIGMGLVQFGDKSGNSYFQANGSLPTTDAPYFRIVDDFYLGWYFGTNTITFTFNCYNIRGWCGITFKKGMRDTEMIIVRNNGNDVSITDYYSLSETRPSRTLMSLVKISGVSNKTGIFATFSRPLNPSSGNAPNIQVNQSFDIGIAYLSSNTQSFEKHNKVSSGNIKFGMYNKTSSFGDGGGGDSIDLDYYRDHGIYMSVMWIGVSQAAIIIMRYFKWWSFSGLIHTLLGTTALVVTLVSSYKTYKKDKVAYLDLDSEDKDFLYHSRIAFTMCGLSLTQFFLGVFFKYMQILKKNIKLNNFSRLTHRIIGWTLPIMGLINIKYGWHLHGETWKNREYIYPTYGVLASVLFLLEMNFQFGKPIRRNLTHFKAFALEYYRGGDPDLNRSLVKTDTLERRRHCEVFDEIMNNRKEWVFYDEFILDVSGFKWNHPGGSFMFKRIAGQDVGKFLNGGSNIDDYRPYFHTDQARNMAEHLAIGHVAFPSSLFVSVNNYETMSEMKWNLTNRTNIAKDTYCLEFSSHNWNINDDAPGVEWIGKHFLVTARVGGKIINRYYSFVLVNLAAWADEVRSAGMHAQVYNVDKEQNKLRLHTKHYRGGLMTDYLTSIPLGTQIQFKGPIGPGICTDSLSGKEFIAFGAGTGLLPFLDLIHAIWKGRVSNTVVHLYISFRDDASSFAVDLAEATAKQHPRNLKLYTRIGQKGYELNAEFWRNMLPLHLAEKAFICGPPVFNRKIEKILIDEGFNPGKILLL